MPESHQEGFPLLHVLDELRHLVLAADLAEHRQDRLVGPAVERPVEGGGGGGG